MIIDDKKSKSSNQQPMGHTLSQRRGTSGSFKRYSLKLRRNTKEGIKEIMSSDGDCEYFFFFGFVLYYHLKVIIILQ